MRRSRRSTDGAPMNTARPSRPRPSVIIGRPSPCVIRGTDLLGVLDAAQVEPEAILVHAADDRRLAGAEARGDGERSDRSDGRSRRRSRRQRLGGLRAAADLRLRRRPARSRYRRRGRRAGAAPRPRRRRRARPAGGSAGAGSAAPRRGRARCGRGAASPRAPRASACRSAARGCSGLRRRRSIRSARPTTQARLRAAEQLVAAERDQVGAARARAPPTTGSRGRPHCVRSTSAPLPRSSITGTPCARPIATSASSSHRRR